MNLMDRWGRGWAAICAAIAGLLVLGGCSAGPTTEHDKSLVVGITADLDNLNPWTATQTQSVNVLGTLYGSLTEVDNNMRIRPGLARSWNVSRDGLAVQLNLRTGVKFADGSSFDATDVVWSLKTLMDKKTAAVAASNLAAIKSVRADGAHAVELRLKTPDAALLSKLAGTTVSMLSAGTDLDKIDSTPNGTGPFRLQKRAPNESVTLKANGRYWGGRPNLDSVEFRVIPDQPAIVSALRADNVQMSVIDDQLVASTIGGDVHVAETPQMSYHALQINARRSPLSDKNLRLALQCAIDRKEVLNTAGMGAGRVTGPLASPDFKSSPADRPCPNVDIAKAKKYLAKAGHPHGLTLNAMVSQGEYSTSVAEAENVQAQLARVGIKLNLETLEISTYIARWASADFDMAFALNASSIDPDTTYAKYFTSGGSFNKVAGYSSSDLNRLFARGAETTDPAARRKTYQQISRNLEENAVWIWLFTGYNFTATAPEVKGFTPLANGSLQNLRNVTIE